MAIILVVVRSIIYNTNQVSAQCGGDLPNLISQCSQFVQKNGPKVPPSPGCCAVLKTFDIKCACQLIPRDVEKYISIPKAIFVARSCGLNLPAGTKCGRKIVLPP
ncbi:hypothetical protein RIF29_32567 [Crotalaria pallida]|uniref:Bifunctional inhibitor/plant lipid transfer protein/seed storage helical domain-containing protein n=1 Tax=Crotalaria pallida TaxID=3830 RepID=A0AAN9HZG4_CROPI